MPRRFVPRFIGRGTKISKHEDPHRASEPAPETGWYQLPNVFGTPTGVRIFIDEGTPAPTAPRGHVWRLVLLD
jgi:hypothetical protein